MEPTSAQHYPKVVEKLVKLSFNELFNATIGHDENGQVALRNISFAYSDKVQLLADLRVEIESQPDIGWPIFVQVLVKFVLQDSGNDDDSLKSSKIWVLLFIAGLIMDCSRDSSARIESFHRQMSRNQLSLRSRCNKQDESELIDFILSLFTGDPLYYKDVLIAVMSRMATFVKQFPTTIIGQEENWHQVIQNVCEQISNFLENESIECCRKERIAADHQFVNALKSWSKYQEKYYVDNFYDYCASRQSYRLGFYAYQCLRKLASSSYDSSVYHASKALNPSDCTKYTQLSADCFAAACIISGNFRSKFVIRKVCYYEVILFSLDNLMIFGFDERSTDRLCGPTIGHDTSSIGFSPGEQCIRYGGKKYHAEAAAWKEGDVIGCYLDVPQQKVKFYLNGLNVQCKEMRLFTESPIKKKTEYLTAASLFGKAMCYFNFGQAPFKYGPVLKQSKNKKTKLLCI